MSQDKHSTLLENDITKTIVLPTEVLYELVIRGGPLLKTSR